MSDARLRQIERAAHDDPYATAALLAARMRRGELTRERVEIAAYAGDEAARLAVPHLVLDRGVTWADVDAQRLTDWVRGLSRWGSEVLVRAAVAAAKAAYARWALGAHAYRAFHAIDAAEAWLACPCEEHRVLCDGENNGGVAADAPWAGAMLMAVLVAAMPPDGDHVGHVRSYVLDAVMHASPVAGEAAACKAIRSSLVAWADR